MVVTCPNCRARYAVDPQKIGFAGRTVQCARCSHRWFEKVARPPAAPTPTPAAEAKPAPENAAAAESSAAAESAATSESAAAPEAAATSESPSAPDPEPIPEMVIRPTTRGAALPVVIPPKVSVWRRVAIAAGVVLLLVGGGMFAFHDEIAALIPAEEPAAPATAAATAPAPAPAKPTMPPAASPRPQLEIDLAKSKIDVVDGRYVVRGEVVNNGTTAGSTSQLRVTFKRNDDVLGEKTFPLVEGPLQPGSRASFSQVLEDPPAGTTDIVPVIE
ncbi:MAG: zinc-ribbon domain-containing protein [Reyranella sp.]|uniref:MJ0042-type zinc finger domain-containing protein n=1 Tax=Reyranella sp. TaxID=1929291 RepID=UPI001ACD3243|nr:MJ0042-type zinc finger domain-containing protein [Reyranella sp.]MBN9085478.1 zinc-ribbon domain-containing protein [Reyranella sp.]